MNDNSARFVADTVGGSLLFASVGESLGDGWASVAAVVGAVAGAALAVYAIRRDTMPSGSEVQE